MLHSLRRRILEPRGVVTAIAASVLTIGVTADAGFSPPDLMMTVDVSNAADVPIFSDSYSLPASAPNGSGFYTYGVPDLGQPTYGFSMGMITGRTQTNDDPLPNLGTQLVPNFTLNNDTGDDLIWRISMTMPVEISLGVDWTTVSGWSLSGPAGQSELSSVDTSPMWTALIDEVVVGTLYDAPTSTTGSLSTPVIGGAFGPVTESIQVDLVFRVSGANDAKGPQTVLVGVNGNLILNRIPAPGGLAILGAGALLLRRRRRRIA